MPRITEKMVNAWYPCARYTPESIHKLFDGRAYITHRGVVNLPIPHKDKLWVLFRLLDNRQLRLLACKFAEYVLPIYAKQIKRKKKHLASVQTYLGIVKKYANGKAQDQYLGAIVPKFLVKPGTSGWDAFYAVLNKDGSMNEKAFSRLCCLAAQCSCTHLPWWDHTRIDPMEG